MMKMKRFFSAILVLGISLTLVSCGGGGADDKGGDASAPGGSSAQGTTMTPADRAKEFITIATGPTSGIYYPIGGAFATALSNWGYTTSAQATAASGENIQLIQDGDAEMAIAMQDSVMQAYEGFGAYDGIAPAENLRAAMRLWPNFVQIVTVKGSGIESVNDLKGKRVGVGAANSGVELNARMIFEAYGMSYQDCTVDYLAYGEAIDNMKNGQCDAVFVTSGLPNASITELSTSEDMVIVPINGEGRENLMAKYPFFSDTIVPADTYNNTEDVDTVYVYNIMLVSAELSEDMVYDMMTGIFEQLEGIQASHNAANKYINMEVGVSDITIPLHPGAEKFWAEQGYR